MVLNYCSQKNVCPTPGHVCMYMYELNQFAHPNATLSNEPPLTATTRRRRGYTKQIKAAFEKSERE